MTETVKQSKQVPVLPQVNKLSNVFGSVLFFIFISGVIFLLGAIFFEDASREITFFESLLPGFFLLISAILATPSVNALSYAATNPSEYFSKTYSEKANQRYNPRYITMHVVVCGLIASILLTKIASENILLEVIFCITYAIAVICFVLLVIYQKKTVV